MKLNQFNELDIEGFDITGSYDVSEKLKRVRTGFSMPGFNIYDYGDVDDGFCYYSDDNHTFYTSYAADINDWVVYSHMEIILTCPFCTASCGCFSITEEKFLKKWMGMHLALFHKASVETYLVRKEQREEYSTLT